MGATYRPNLTNRPLSTTVQRCSDLGKVFGARCLRPLLKPKRVENTGLVSSFNEMFNPTTIFHGGRTCFTGTGAIEERRWVASQHSGWRAWDAIGVAEWPRRWSGERWLAASSGFRGLRNAHARMPGGARTKTSTDKKKKNTKIQARNVLQQPYGLGAQPLRSSD